MTTKLAEWASELRQITKIKPSDASGEDSVPSKMVPGYEFMNLEVIWEMLVMRWSHIVGQFGISVKVYSSC